MSHSIEYNRKLFKLKSASPDIPEQFLLCLKTGDNNCFDSSGHRTRSWYLAFIGNENSFWPTIGERAGWCQGGGLQRAFHWRDTNRITVEEYIALYRKTFRTAKPADNIFSTFGIEFEITLRGDKQKAKQISDIQNVEYREALISFTDKYQITLRESNDWYGYKTMTASLKIDTIEKLTDAATLKLHLNNGITLFHFEEMSK